MAAKKKCKRDLQGNADFAIRMLKQNEMTTMHLSCWLDPNRLIMELALKWQLDFAVAREPFKLISQNAPASNYHSRNQMACSATDTTICVIQLSMNARAAEKSGCRHLNT